MSGQSSTTIIDLVDEDEEDEDEELEYILFNKLEFVISLNFDVYYHLPIFLIIHYLYTYYIMILERNLSFDHNDNICRLI